MKEYTRSALGKQGGVDARAVSAQYFFVTACDKSIDFCNIKKSHKKIHRSARIPLARSQRQARESKFFPAHAANVTLSLLGAKGGVL